MENRPILSICIPTYNRAQFLKRTVESITNTKVFQETNKVEIVISDNCSTDNTEEICREFKDKWGEKIVYVKQETPLFPDVNMFKPIDYASGIFCKLNNDTCAWREGIVEEALEVIESNIEEDVVIFLGNAKPTDEKLTKCNSLGEVVKIISVVITWVGCFCIKKSTYENMEEPLRYVETRFPISDIIGRLCAEDKSILIYNSNQFDIVLPHKKGASYNVAEAFGKNYFWVLEKYLDKHNGISKEVFEEEKKKAANHVNTYYFDYAETFAFEQTGYLKHMLKYFKFNLYFWIKYFCCRINYNIFYFKFRGQGCYALLRLFGKPIFIKRNFKKLWRKRNKHNATELITSEFFDKIFTDWNTKGKIEIVGNAKYNRGTLTIGKYVTISEGVKFYLTPSAEENCLSTFNKNEDTYNLKNIVIKDDVWLGEEVKIKSGVTIGQGAIIGMGSIITKDIPSYAIVENSEITGYRFSKEVTDKLLKIDFQKHYQLDTNTLKQYINDKNIDEVINAINEQ